MKFDVKCKIYLKKVFIIFKKMCLCVCMIMCMYDYFINNVINVNFCKNWYLWLICYL